MLSLGTLIKGCHSLCLANQERLLESAYHIMAATLPLINVSMYKGFTSHITYLWHFLLLLGSICHNAIYRYVFTENKSVYKPYKQLFFLVR